MTFYQELQLNQAGSKNLLKKSETLKEKLYHMWVLCKEKSSNECREVTEKYRTGRSAYLWLGQLFMRLFAGLL